MKIQIGKNYGVARKSTIIERLQGEKEKYLTAVLYNSSRFSPPPHPNYDTSPLVCGVSAMRKIENFLVQAVFDLHLSKPEVHVIEFFNSDFSFICHLESIL